MYHLQGSASAVSAACVRVLVAVSFLALSCRAEPTQHTQPAQPIIPAHSPLDSPIIVPANQSPFTADATLTLLPPTLAATPTLITSPTLTPTPTPTRGPSPTPMPLVGPAPNGVGTILFPVREKNSFFAGLYAIHTNAAGVPIDLPVRRSAEVRFEWGDIHIAPDGRRVAIGNGWTIAILNNTDKSLRGPLREKASPLFYFYDWHPDSRHILLLADGGMGGVWLVDTDTGDYTQLATDYSSSVFCAGGVSPDGQRVVYSRSSGMQSEVWIVATNGDSPTRISTGMAPCGFAWSPDGSKIAFMGHGLQVMNADGSNLRALSRHAKGGYQIKPVWSPDSQTLAFIAQDGPLPSNGKNTTSPGLDLREWEDRQDFTGTNIHLVNIITGVERRLLPGTGNTDPAWSPDGKHIVFASTRGVSAAKSEGEVGVSEIWMVNADGTHLRQLTHMGLRTRYPAWVKPSG